MAEQRPHGRSMRQAATMVGPRRRQTKGRRKLESIIDGYVHATPDT